MGDRLVQPVDGSHFYLPDKTPFYDVEMKSKPGEFRKATVKDALNIGAYPSTTTVLGVLDKPALTAWKISNAIIASLTLPRIDGEGDDDFARRVAEDADSVGRGAADLGTTVHAAIESYFSNREVPDTMAPYVNPVDAWIIKEKIKLVSNEQVYFNNNLLYGCKVDAIGVDESGKEIIIDWKTQKADKKGKLNAYEENLYQLSANARAVRPNSSLEGMRVINVFVSTTTKDANGNADIMVKEWTLDEVALGFRLFELCREIYKIKNNI